MFNRIPPDGRLLKDSTVADLKTLAPVRMRMITFPVPYEYAAGFHNRYMPLQNVEETTDTVHNMTAGYFDQPD